MSSGTSVAEPASLWLVVDSFHELLTEHGISGEIDLLSIDIDGNDYWIWEAIEVVDPRIVIVETNPRPPPSQGPWSPEQDSSRRERSRMHFRWWPHRDRLAADSMAMIEELDIEPVERTQRLFEAAIRTFWRRCPDFVRARRVHSAREALPRYPKRPRELICKRRAGSRAVQPHSRQGLLEE